MGLRLDNQAKLSWSLRMRFESLSTVWMLRYGNDIVGTAF